MGTVRVDVDPVPVLVLKCLTPVATVFQDQAYWQRAIASRPASCVKAYLLGGIAW